MSADVVFAGIPVRLFFVRRVNASFYSWSNVEQIHALSKAACIFNDEAMKIRKQIFLELGLRVIRYQDYNELPRLQNSLR